MSLISRISPDMPLMLSDRILICCFYAFSIVYVRYPSLISPASKIINKIVLWLIFDSGYCLNYLDNPTPDLSSISQSPRLQVLVFSDILWYYFSIVSNLLFSWHSIGRKQESYFDWTYSKLSCCSDCRMHSNN